MKKVVITGIGMINGVGNNASESFNAILEGKSGVDYISYFDTTNSAVKIASEVKGFDPLSVMSAKELKKYDRYIHLGIHSAKEAMENAKLNVNNFDPNRMGVSGSTGYGGLGMLQNNIIETVVHNKKISPYSIPGTLTSMLSGYSSIYFNLKGPNISSTTACAAGIHAIIQAAKTIMTDGADIMLAVGSESAITTMGIGGFHAMRALSTKNENPKMASSPFDKNRDGFVMGEGSGAIILESLEHAQKRNAKIYAVISGFGESADASHLAFPSIDGPIRSIEAALRMAKYPIIDYINAHGTGTPVGDANETKALKEIFKDKMPPISSIKGSIGHCLGAAGVIETVVSIMALEQNILPPTINLIDDDPECDLDYVPNCARQKTLNTVLTANYGFGGTNGALILEKYTG